MDYHILKGQQERREGKRDSGEITNFAGLLRYNIINSPLELLYTLNFVQPSFRQEYYHYTSPPPN